MSGDSPFMKYLSSANQEDSPKAPRSSSIHELKKLKQEISKTEREISKCQAAIQEHLLRSNLLSNSSKRHSKLLIDLKELNKRVEERYQNQMKIASTSSDHTYYTRDVRFDNDDTAATKHAPGIESSCMRSVREACEEIASHYQEIYSKEAGLHGESEAGNRSKDEIWTKIEEILGSHSPSEIMQSLQRNIEDSTGNLEEITSRIDLRKDAEQLRFQFESGKLKDVSDKPALLKTVHQLIEDGQVAHFQRFLAKEKAANEAFKLEKQLKTMNKEIKSKLESKFADPDIVKRVGNLLLVQQAEMSAKESLKYLESEINTLSNERRLKEEAMAVLQAKYRRIQDFEQVVEAKQGMIRCLIKDNGSARSKHAMACLEVEDALEEKMRKTQDDLVSLSKKFVEKSREENDLFLKLPLENLHFVEHSSASPTLARDVSINRFDSWYGQAGEKSLLKMMDAIEMETYSPSEDVYSKVLELRSKNHNIARELDHIQGNAQSNSLTDSSAKASELCQQAAVRKRNEAHTYMPSLKSSQEKANTIMSECLNFRSAANMWWEQPAQFTVPWVSDDDGTNLQQYHDQFAIHAAMLTKMQLVK